MSTITAIMSDRHQQKPYPLRMPDELRANLEMAAAPGKRSLHAEIIGRLEQSFIATTDDETVQKLQARLEQQEFTISTLTTLAHSLAALGQGDMGGLDVVAFILKNLERQPDSSGERDKLIASIAKELKKVERPSERIKRRAIAQKI